MRTFAVSLLALLAAVGAAMGATMGATAQLPELQPDEDVPRQAPIDSHTPPLTAPK